MSITIMELADVESQFPMECRSCDSPHSFRSWSALPSRGMGLDGLTMKEVRECECGCLLTLTLHRLVTTEEA